MRQRSFLFLQLLVYSHELSPAAHIPSRPVRLCCIGLLRVCCAIDSSRVLVSRQRTELTGSGKKSVWRSCTCEPRVSHPCSTFYFCSLSGSYKCQCPLCGIVAFCGMLAAIAWRFKLQDWRGVMQAVGSLEFQGADGVFMAQALVLVKNLLLALVLDQCALP